LARRYVASDKMHNIDEAETKYHARTERWSNIASSASKRKISAVSSSSSSSFSSNVVLVDANIQQHDVASESRRLSFTSLQVSPPKSADVTMEVDAHAADVLMFNNEDFGNDDFMFQEQQEYEDEDEQEEEDEQEDEQEEQQENDGGTQVFFESPQARRRSSSRRRTPLSSGKKAIRIAACGGIVLVDEESEDDSVDEQNDATIGNIIESSVVRMKTIRVVSENDRRSLGSRKALTPVRRSTRLLRESNDYDNVNDANNDDNDNSNDNVCSERRSSSSSSSSSSGSSSTMSTLQLLRQSDMTYVPNPALQGAHFAEEIPVEENDDDNESSLCFDGFSSGGPVENQVSNSSTSDEEHEREREATPMPARRFGASHMPPPPPRIMESTTALEGVTPVRRTTSVAGSSLDETPAHLRQEMANMLGIIAVEVRRSGRTPKKRDFIDPNPSNEYNREVKRKSSIKKLHPKH